MPLTALVAVKGYVLAEPFQTQSARVAGLVAASTVISVGAIPDCIAKLL